MVTKVLIWLAICMVLGLGALWLYAGGYREIVSFVRTIPNPVDIIWGTSTSTYRIKLPWEVAIPQGPDISGYATDEDGRDPSEQLADLEDQYKELEAKSKKLRIYGAPSSYAGRVVLSAGNATESDYGKEYIELSADSGNSSAVDLAGWSLQSMVSGIRVSIPPAALPFILGTVNSMNTVLLAPGEAVIVTSGPSPVGASFRENICTGYLSQLQDFDPPLANACPPDSKLAPMTPENLKRYGSECFDYIQNLPQCNFPQRMPAELSSACRAFVTNVFSHNGCVNAFRTTSTFALDTWRLFVGSRSALWSDSHDIIRLLDADGRTVDVLSY